MIGAALLVLAMFAAVDLAADVVEARRRRAAELARVRR